ncbi:MAG TPA: hypothetical protein VJ854_02830, partial [Sphaerochaeta sp.]|nr:hypothetical protein [Sphaerochaeta sp.]
METVAKAILQQIFQVPIKVACSSYGSQVLPFEQKTCDKHEEGRKESLPCGLPLKLTLHHAAHTVRSRGHWG